MKVIREFIGEYRFLSNFWSCYVLCGGLLYPSVENAYQAMKMKNPKDRKKFLYLKASEAKRLGRVLPKRDNWELHRLTVMHGLLQEKFKDATLRKLLLKTGDARLEEGNWWGDEYWGTVNGVGDNHLGKLLMKVRDELR